MISEEQIKRINELARKSKQEGLTEDELVEQANLRNQYIASVRASFRSQLDSIKVVKVDEDGKTLH